MVPTNQLSRTQEQRWGYPGKTNRRTSCLTVDPLVQHGRATGVWEHSITKTFSASNKRDSDEMKWRKAIRFLEFYGRNGLITLLGYNYVISSKKTEEGLKGQGHHCWGVRGGSFIGPEIKVRSFLHKRALLPVGARILKRHICRLLY